ncbi:MAG TPA: glycosyltransferase family 4 protein [Thermoguttaceae bacterium]|nr:glycosyltransferase family 4 protein [Thermoguttaceae bacterium]
MSTMTHELDTKDAAREERVVAAPPVRVLHVINGEHYAGAERVQDTLALGLAEHGFEVSFACLKPGRFEPMRRAKDAPLYDVSMRSRLDLRSVGRLARLLRRGRFALVHTHNPRTAMIGSLAAAWRGVPLVHHVHTQTREEVDDNRLRRFSALIERRSLARARGLISVSESISRYLRDHGYDGRRIWLVPNGVPAPRELPVRSRPAGAWTLGVLALFRPRKGLEVILRAMAELRQAGIAARLRVVGPFDTPGYEQSVRRLASDLGLAEQVDWLGFRADVHDELRRMDVFVLPSVLSEGMPMSVLEAMGAGTPVVATRVDGVTDVVRDGEDGLLAAPGDASDLARVLAAVVRGEVDCDRMRRNAHRRQAEAFSDRSMAAGVAKVYREVIQEYAEALGR